MLKKGISMQVKRSNLNVNMQNCHFFSLKTNVKKMSTVFFLISSYKIV